MRAAFRTAASSRCRRVASNTRPGTFPGAVHLDYADDLSDPATPYAARVAPPELFARVMGEHGIGDDTIVLAYDAGTIPFAARLVWMLRYYGHDEAYVIAGGFPAWAGAGYPVKTDVVECAPATFTPRAHRSCAPRAMKCWRSPKAAAGRN